MRGFSFYASQENNSTAVQLVYAADRYDKDTMTEFQNIFNRVVSAIVNNSNSDSYDFEQLKKDVCGKKGLKQILKDVFDKKQ